MAIHAKRVWIIGESITLDDVTWHVFAVSDDADPIVRLTDNMFEPGCFLDVNASDLDESLYRGDSSVPTVVQQASLALLRARLTDAQATQTLRDAESVLLELHQREMTAVRGRKCLRRCETVLDTWSIFIPRRVANEELGDCLEALAARIEKRQYWRARFTAGAYIFWTAVHAVHYALGRRSSSRA